MVYSYLGRHNIYGSPYRHVGLYPVVRTFYRPEIEQQDCSFKSSQSLSKCYGFIGTILKVLRILSVYIASLRAAPSNVHGLGRSASGRDT